MYAALKKEALPCLLLLLLAIPLFFINIQDMHGWGDDFSLYIKEAQNIAAGKPYNSFTWQYNPHNPDYSPPQYPPMYPLMLAPVVSIWGLSIKAMNYFNSAIAACLLFALYGYFRNHAGKVAALCLAIFATYCGQMICLKDDILADVSCLLFIVLYLWLRERDGYTHKRGLLLAILAVCALQARSQAICLLAGEGVLWAVDTIKQWLASRSAVLRRMALQPQMVIVPCALLLHFVLTTFVFPSRISVMPFYYDIFRRAIADSSLKGMFSDAYAALQYTADLIYYSPGPGIFAKPAALLATLSIWAAIAGFGIKAAQKLTISACYALPMLGLLMYYPFKDPRYFIVLLPVFILYAFTAFQRLLSLVPGRWQAVAGWVPGLLIFIPLLANLQFMATYHPGGCIPAQREKDAFSYISAHIGNDDIIVFTKPRLLALFTGKKTINVSWHLSPQRNRQVLDSLGVRYMLVLNGLDDGYFYDYLRNVNAPVDSVVIGGGYTLYTLN